MEHKIKVVLGTNVHKQINWLTQNYENEIGAVGTGKIKTKEGKKYYYIDQLLFPKQKVSSATVHFTGEMWIDIIKNTSKEDLKRIMFYWHKHPDGSAAHSHTDEEDTFETFMDDKANRKQFIFLQTAKKTGGGLVREARVDLRHPVRHTILDSDIHIGPEPTPEDVKLEQECLKLIEEVIIKPEPYKCNVPSLPNHTGFQSYDYGWDGLLLENSNDYPDEEKCFIICKNGEIVIGGGKLLSDEMNLALSKDGEFGKDLVRRFKKKKKPKLKMTIYKLQPASKKYFDLRKAVYDFFRKFNINISANHESDEEEDAYYESNALGNATITKKDDVYIISGDRDVVDLYEEALYSIAFVSWDKNLMNGKVCDLDNINDQVGTVYKTPDGNGMTFMGKRMIKVIEQLIEPELEYHLNKNGGNVQNVLKLFTANQISPN